ncbi:MAG: chromosome segregation protein SMC, partial [Candidatus Aenigmatarchaeota archaeon]
MVRINRITLRGFKSFADKVSIPFPTGFNVIAGPNGSGKSNIVDAIMFVLGVSSAKMIRANKLQTLIFNGGKDRKPASYAEVSLYLDNKDGQIPLKEEEIKITRKVNRKGTSVYKINGKNVTKRKFVDILANANLYADGYNIIVQGDVTRVIEMNTQERKGIIDDICGIAEFDEKKKKAMQELEHIETRVREMLIIVNEKERLKRKLEEEKRNAEKYLQLEKKLEKLKASLIKKKLENAQDEWNA